MLHIAGNKETKYCPKFPDFLLQTKSMVFLSDRMMIILIRFRSMNRFHISLYMENWR